MLARKQLEVSGRVHRRATSEETLTAMEAFSLGMVAMTVVTIATFSYLPDKVVLLKAKRK